MGTLEKSSAKYKTVPQSDGSNSLAKLRGRLSHPISGIAIGACKNTDSKSCCLNVPIIFTFTYSQ